MRKNKVETKIGDEEIPSKKPVPVTVEVVGTVNMIEEEDDILEKPVVLTDTHPKGDWVSNVIDVATYEDTMKNKWLAQIVYGPPRMTRAKSLDTLIKEGYIGVYFKEKK